MRAAPPAGVIFFRRCVWADFLAFVAFLLKHGARSRPF